MARVKRGTQASKRRKSALKHTKGFRWGRKSKFKEAKQALMHAWTYAFRDRKSKKRFFRGLWQSRIGSFCQNQELSYSSFISKMKKNNVELDRKILSQLSEDHPEVLEEIIKTVK